MATAKKGAGRWAAMRACVRNATRLLDDAEMLEFEEPPASRYFLSVIAQEEYSKAFLLYLVLSGVIPWSAHLLRVMRDHKCKHLIGIVLDFLTPDTDLFLQRIDASLSQGVPLDYPARVADAINVLRYEKIGRWESNAWVWAEDPNWDPDAQAAAEGQRDGCKQGALYVKIGRNGNLAASPDVISAKEAEEEYERGRRFGQLLSDLAKFQRPTGADWERVESAFRLLFAVKAEPGHALAAQKDARK